MIDSQDTIRNVFRLLVLVACPFYWAFAGAIDFDFDDGSLESWTLDEVRDGNTGAYYGSGNLALSWDDATQYPGAPNLYPHGDALGDFLGSANMGSFVVLPDAFPDGALWFVDLTSPSVTSDSAWQGINGLSVKVRCDVSNLSGAGYWAQILLKVRRISDNGQTYIALFDSYGQPVFHDIHTDTFYDESRSPIHWMNITPNFGDLSNYIIDNVIVRFWGTSSNLYRYPSTGQLIGDVSCHIDNVHPVSDAPTIGVRGKATISLTSAAGCGAEEPTGYNKDIILQFDSDYVIPPKLLSARIVFSNSNVKRGISSPGLCDSPQTGISWLNDRVVDLSYDAFDPGELRRVHTVLARNDNANLSVEGNDYVGATVSLTFADLPGTCTIPLADFVSTGPYTATATFSCAGDNEMACFDGVDNDMDGATDCADSDCNGRTAGSCSTGEAGICEPGTTTCSGGVAACVGDTGPQVEGPHDNLTCADALDNDCDGALDASDSDCVAGNTPPGNNVEVCDDTNQVCVTFENVEPPGGDTTVTVVDCEPTLQGIVQPQENPVCVDIQSSAVFDLAWVCVPYDDTVCVNSNQTLQRICELDTFDLIRCANGECNTLLAEDQDTDANIVCGLTPEFSTYFSATLLDSDADGRVDLDDNCPLVPNTLQEDTDSDNVGDVCDNCILAPNTGQTDTDSDGYGNRCDGDLNNDGSTNTLDLNLYKQAHRSASGDANYNIDADFNTDGVINTLDLNIYKGLHRSPPGPSCCGIF